MTPERQVRVVKCSERKTTLQTQNRDKINEAELLRRWQEFRRAYLAFESFLKSAGVIRPE